MTDDMPASINRVIAMHLDACEETGTDPLLTTTAAYELLDDEAKTWLGEQGLFELIFRALPPHDSEYDYATRPPGEAGVKQRLQDFIDDMRATEDNLRTQLARKDAIIRRLLDIMPDTDFDALVAEIDSRQRTEGDDRDL